jgi:hypothetical protein
MKNTRRAFTMASLTFLLGSALLTSGCGGSLQDAPVLTKEKYEAISPGMSLSQVKAIIGTDPTTTGTATTAGTATVQTYAWENGSESITITLTGGKTTAKSYTGPNFSYSSSV